VSTVDCEPSGRGFIPQDIVSDAALLEGFRAGEVNPFPCHSAENYTAGLSLFVDLLAQCL
jgi:hypothetical protein